MQLMIANRTVANIGPLRKIISTHSEHSQVCNFSRHPLRSGISSWQMGETDNVHLLQGLSFGVFNFSHVLVI